MSMTHFIKILLLRRSSVANIAPVHHDAQGLVISTTSAAVLIAIPWRVAEQRRADVQAGFDQLARSNPIECSHCHCRIRRCVTLTTVAPDASRSCLSRVLREVPRQPAKRTLHPVGEMS